ncbi:HAD family hydrolase [Nostoc sp.]|uniref:HAD family hydrolase n=1 Tax=Nostoc sp. TaxID=1180 RepID=UPI002FF78B24
MKHYDDKLATDNHVNKNTLAAPSRLRSSGYKLILVTDRQLDELLQVFLEVDLFDYVVAENGALLYSPATHQKKLLGSQPSAELINALCDRLQLGENRR